MSEAVCYCLRGHTIPSLAKHMNGIKDRDVGRFGLVNIGNVPQEDSLSVMDFQVLDNSLVHGLGL